jgi:hypothetical protein
MTHPQEWLRRKTLRRGPAAPLLFHVPGRVDQYAIEIEKNRPALESFHSDRTLPANFGPASDGTPRSEWRIARDRGNLT